MKKQMILALVLVFAALANPLRAQENNTPLQWEIDSLKTVIKGYDREIKEKEKKLEPINRAKNNCDKANVQIRHYRSMIEKNRNAIDSIQGLLKEMMLPCDSLRVVNKNLESYKTQVSPLVSRQLSQMATAVDNTWLGKTYAETDFDYLADELKLYKDFKEHGRGVAAAYEKLAAFSENVMLYKQGIEIVNNPYDSHRLFAIIQPFENLVKKETHPGRKEELETLLRQLKDYSDCLKCFQNDIVGEIDEMLEAYKRDGTSKKAWKQVRSFLESAEGNTNVIKLSQIPWLEKQYRLYVQQLESDPYAFNQAREVIMGLQP